MKNCPYCIKVLKYMKKNDIEVPLKEINEDQAAEETLKKEGGKVQVPCLFIAGEPLYESDDIIQWFKNNWE